MTEEVRTPTISSGRSNLDIDHSEGTTTLTLTQQFRIEGYIPNGDIYRLMGGTDKTMLMRLSKVAIKHMPQSAALEEPKPSPIFWNGDPANSVM